MSKVTIELSEYNELRDAAKELDQTKAKMEEAQKAHENEIHELKEEGKIAVMVESPLGRLFGCKPFIKEIVGLDKVRSQIEEAIISEEVGKANSKLIKELAEANTKISDLEEELESIKSRNFWQRLRNLF